MSLWLKNISLCCNNKYLLRNISLEVSQGEIVALIGQSGSGKTLSLSIIQGIIPANITKTSGEIYLDNAILSDSALKAMRGKEIASIIQHPQSCFNPLWSIQSHIKETLKTPYNKDIAINMLNKVGLNQSSDNKANKHNETTHRILKSYPFMLSGGMLQRIMIGLALLNKPRFLLADEPTSSLDSISQERIATLLDNLCKSENLGVLLVTHDISLALRLANRIYIIDNGIICEQIDIPKHLSSTIDSSNNANNLDSTLLHKKLIQKLSFYATQQPSDSNTNNQTLHTKSARKKASYATRN